MSKLPIVTIVGRQNVGKSTLFNSIIKHKKAIVDSVAGLTRDIISYNVNYKTISFKLSDSPGLDLDNSAELSSAIIDNAIEHLKRSDTIIFLLENPGAEKFDMELAEMLRKLNIPTIIAVNKMDSVESMENMTNFYEMGFNDIVPISALRNYNVNMLLDKTIDSLPVKKTKVVEPDLKITIVGRPNAGKSTLLNAFMGYDRAVVSSVAGTTRDSVDEEFVFNNQNVQIIDTAGIRKKSKITGNVEYYSLTRTIKSIEKSDIVIHLIDAEIGLTDTDKKISDEIIKAKKPTIIAINKWDAIADKNQKTFEEFKERLIFKFYIAEDYPIISISAKERLRTHKILETAFTLKERAVKRIGTPKLNRIVIDLQSKHKIPQLGHTIKIYYATQIDTVPPQFKMFVNNPELFRKDIMRYFQKALQKELDLKGIPIIIHLEGKDKTKNPFREKTELNFKNNKKNKSTQVKNSNGKIKRSKKR